MHHTKVANLQGKLILEFNKVVTSAQRERVVKGEGYKELLDLGDTVFFFLTWGGYMGVCFLIIHYIVHVSFICFSVCNISKTF